MKKLLLVTSSLDAGGAELWVYNMLRSAARPKELVIDYFFFEGVKDGRLLASYKETCRNVVFGNCTTTGVKKIHEIGVCVADFIKEHGPYDAIHLNGTKIVYQALVMRIAKKMGIPVRIVHCHNTQCSRLPVPLSFGREIARRMTVRNATVVGACSRPAAYVRYGKGIEDNEKYHLFKNGIDLDKFAFDEGLRRGKRVELGLKDETVLLNVGSLEELKNQSFLLDVMVEYLVIQPESHLVIVGEGPDADMLRKKAEILGIAGNVTMAPWTEQLEAYYAAADVFLLPSISEGLPFVTVEAQTCGLTCVVSTGVPAEADATGLVRFLGLSEGARSWAEAVEPGPLEERARYRDVVARSGYGLEEAANDFYGVCIGRL